MINSQPALLAKSPTFLVAHVKEVNYCLFYFVSGSESCYNTLSAEGDILQSPNFPAPYDNNVLCTTPIQAPEGYQVQLNFTHFSLEYVFDFVNVYDGPDDSSQLIGTYCGNASPLIIQSSGRYLYVVFISDSSVISSGYQATLSFVGRYFLSKLTAHVLQSLGIKVDS